MMKQIIKIFLLVGSLGLVLAMMIWGVSNDEAKRNLLPPDTICTNYKVVSYYEKIDGSIHWMGPETKVLCIISQKDLEEVSQ